MTSDNDVDVDPLPHTDRADLLAIVQTAIVEGLLDPPTRRALWDRFGALDALVGMQAELDRLSVADRRAFVAAVAGRAGFSGDSICFAVRAVHDGADIPTVVQGSNVNQDRATAFLAEIDRCDLPLGALAVLVGAPFTGRQGVAFLRLLDGESQAAIEDAQSVVLGAGPEVCDAVLESTMYTGDRLRNELGMHARASGPAVRSATGVRPKATFAKKFPLLAIRAFATDTHDWAAFLARAGAEITTDRQQVLMDEIEAARLDAYVDPCILAAAVALDDRQRSPQTIVAAVQALPQTAQELLTRWVKDDDTRTVPYELVTALADQYTPDRSSAFVRVVLLMIEAEPALRAASITELVDKAGSVQRGSTWQHIMHRIKREPEFAAKLRTRFQEAIAEGTVISDVQIIDLLQREPVVESTTGSGAASTSPARTRARRTNVNPKSRGL